MLKDKDGGGIPEAWEKKHKLKPNDATDGKWIAANGYSNLEEYLNDLVIKTTT